MDVTEILGLPYPECDPPLTKDASNIKQLRDLAVAVDTAVGELNQEINDRLVSPDAVRLNRTVALTSTDADNLLPMTAIVFDNTPGDAMSDLVNGGIKILRDGWYHLGAWVECTVASQVQPRIRFLVNGDPLTNFGGPSGLVTANAQSINVQDMLFLREDDLVMLQSRTGAPGTSVDYAPHMWAVLAAPND